MDGRTRSGDWGSFQTTRSAAGGVGAFKEASVQKVGTKKTADKRIGVIDAHLQQMKIC